MSRWFRFYDDALNDPKILRLPDGLYRSWVGILCIASKCEGNLPCVDDVAIMLRQSVSSTQNILTRLEGLTLLDRSKSGVLSPHNWLKRQYKSDVSTERVREFRKRRGNVSETPPDTEQITEQSRADFALARSNFSGHERKANGYRSEENSVIGAARRLRDRLATEEQGSVCSGESVADVRLLSEGGGERP